MRNALDEIVVDGIRSNIPLHRGDPSTTPPSRRRGLDIHYLEQQLGLKSPNRRPGRLSIPELDTDAVCKRRLKPPRPNAERIEEILESVGAGAVMLEDAADQPLFEPPLGTTPLWDATRVVALFTPDSEMDAILEFVQSELGQPLPPHRVEILEDQVWERDWMEHYHPMRFGDRLWVCPAGRRRARTRSTCCWTPAWRSAPAPTPTTALCLEWLDGLDLKDKTVIDYGCGSGILGRSGVVAGCAPGCGRRYRPAGAASHARQCRSAMASATVSQVLARRVPQLPTADICCSRTSSSGPHRARAALRATRAARGAARAGRVAGGTDGRGAPGRGALVRAGRVAQAGRLELPRRSQERGALVTMRAVRRASHGSRIECIAPGRGGGHDSARLEAN